MRLNSASAASLGWQVFTDRLIGHAIGQVESKLYERSLLDQEANYFKQSVELIDCTF